MALSLVTAVQVGELYGLEAEAGVAVTYTFFASLRVARPIPCRRRSCRPAWTVPTALRSSIREVSGPPAQPRVQACHGGEGLPASRANRAAVGAGGPPSPSRQRSVPVTEMSGVGET